MSRCATGKIPLCDLGILAAHDGTAYHTIRISYCCQDVAECAHEVNLAAIMFSEYYFYLIAYLADGRKDFLTIFPIDRIVKFEPTGANFRAVHSKKIQ